MSREDRLQRMQRLFRMRRSISMNQLMTELEVKRATVTRYLSYLKNTFGIPILWDSTTRGYRVAGTGTEGDAGLLGLWFSPTELQALLTMDQLIRRIEPGILRSHIDPLKERLKKILGAEAHSLEEIERRVRVLPMIARPVDAKIFQAILAALLNRKRLSITYTSRTDGKVSTRVVSPQRLVHYRDNWYLDAWCHKSRGLRMFSVDAVGSTVIVDERARDMSEEYLRAVLEIGYGIFSGRRTKLARLRFSPTAARWVSTEMWHPRQKTSWDKKGNYLLKFPYSSHPELVMDLLRHVPEVEVLGPKSLRMHLSERIKRGAQNLR
jgi:predicted DNA-binding transcriptional regulator YafY